MPSASKVNSRASRPRHSPLHPSQNDLPSHTRQKMVLLLQACLVEAIDLTLQCKQAHWNVKGPQFLQLHGLFDAAYDEARAVMDDLAERAVALGGQVDGTQKTVAQTSALPAYPAHAQAGEAHVAALSASLAALAQRVRAGIDAATQAEDAITADVLTQVGGTLDKRLWLVEAHLPPC